MASSKNSLCVERCSRVHSRPPSLGTTPKKGWDSLRYPCWLVKIVLQTPTSLVRCRVRNHLGEKLQYVWSCIRWQGGAARDGQGSSTIPVIIIKLLSLPGKNAIITTPSLLDFLFHPFRDHYDLMITVSWKKNVTNSCSFGDEDSSLSMTTQNEPTLLDIATLAGMSCYRTWNPKTSRNPPIKRRILADVATNFGLIGLMSHNGNFST